MKHYGKLPETKKTIDKQAEKTPVLPAEPPSPKPKPISLEQHQHLMQAKTERLITADETKSGPEIQNEVIPRETLPVLTAPSLSPFSDTYSPGSAEPITGSNLTRFSNTGSLSIAKPELNETPYYDERLFKEKKTEAATIPYEVEKVDKKPKPLWLLPLAAIGVLGVSGIGGVIFLKNLTSTDSAQPITKPTITASTPTPVIVPSYSPVFTPSVLPSQSPTSLPVQPGSDKKNEKPKPTMVASPNKTPIQNTVKQSQQKTQKPKSDDCIYNGKCS